MVTVVCEKEVTVMECATGGLQKCPKFGCSGDTFGGCWLLLILMIVSTQRYGPFAKNAPTFRPYFARI